MVHPGRARLSRRMANIPPSSILQTKVPHRLRRLRFHDSCSDLTLLYIELDSLRVRLVP